MARLAVAVALALALVVPGAAAQKNEVTKKVTDSNAAEVARKKHARILEERMLAAGFDMSFYAEGENATTLRLRYILMSRPMVYKLANGSDFVPAARDLGFRRIVFADGRRKPWVLNLITNSFE